jgi:cyclophilin family peptidyl-prolyl cis-trans isomerase
MAAWSEEQAKYFYVMTWIFRVVTFLGYSFLIWYAYRVAILTERRLRGTENLPAGLRIGNVVYLDLESHGNFVGRVVIGLLNEDCPLYCEYFHRRCTGSGGKDDSFRGVKMQSLMPNHAAMFGDGAEMTHEVPGFHPNWLPTERESEGAWRGAVSSICLDRERQTPNFIFHISAGDYTPQVFGMVLSGWDTIEKISRAGNTAGGMPKMECTISGCGELCTLDKAHITPLPWKLFESVSTGYDADKYGEKADRSLLQPPASFSSTLTKSLDHITLQSKESMGLTNGTIPL